MINKKSNNYNNTIRYIFIIGIIGLIIGSFYDLKLSRKLYQSNIYYSNFFKFFAETPMIILISTSSLILLSRNKDKLNIFVKIFLLVISIAFPLFSSIGIPRYFSLESVLIPILILSTYSLIIYYLVSKYIKTKQIEDEKYDKYLVFVIVSIILIFLIYNLIKYIWGRPRFISFINEENFSEFRNWWVINKRPTSDLYKSFPSGHTASAATSMLILYLPLFKKDSNINQKEIKNQREIYKIKRKENNIKRYIFEYFPMVWILSVALSRIIDGAHFLSDVSMSMILSSIIIYFTKKYILD